MKEQVLKLGDKVKFIKSLKETGNSGFPSEIEYLSDEESKKLEEGNVVNVVFKAPVEHKEMTGIVVGKRRISTNTDFVIYQTEYEDEHLVADHQYETIYLVACNLAGFKRVLPEDLEVAK